MLGLAGFALYDAEDPRILGFDPVARREAREVFRAVCRETGDRGWGLCVVCEPALTEAVIRLVEGASDAKVCEDSEGVFDRELLAGHTVLYLAAPQEDGSVKTVLSGGLRCHPLEGVKIRGQERTLCLVTAGASGEAESEEAETPVSTCTVVVPSDFVPWQEAAEAVQTTAPCLFVHRNYPMESAVITWHSGYAGADIPSEETLTELMTPLLDAEVGGESGYEILSMEETMISDVPARRVLSRFYREGQEITVTGLFVQAPDRETLITWSCADDDDCEESFARSEASVRVQLR